MLRASCRFEQGFRFRFSPVAAPPSLLLVVIVTFLFSFPLPCLRVSPLRAPFFDPSFSCLPLALFVRWCLRCACLLRCLHVLLSSLLRPRPFMRAFSSLRGPCIVLPPLRWLPCVPSACVSSLPLLRVCPPFPLRCVSARNPCLLVLCALLVGLTLTLACDCPSCACACLRLP
jgi:hypothetical protein